MVTLTIADVMGSIDDKTIWVQVDDCSIPCFSNGLNNYATSKRLLKVIDILGRETKQTNQPLFYIYDDGTVKKRIIIE